MWVEQSRRQQPAYRCEDAAAPDEGEQVEDGQLSRLIKLAVLGLGEVQPPVHFLQFKPDQEVRRGSATAETFTFSFRGFSGRI